MGKLEYFSHNELQVVNASAELAEELVSNYYKLSTSQLLRLNYDIKTLQELAPDEIVDDHFAQLIRYSEKKRDSLLDTFVKDFYKICLQDHAIISAIKNNPKLDLLAFVLYIISHELIHVIRFKRFLQQFDAPIKDRIAEEVRVHAKTQEVLKGAAIDGLQPVLKFYENWRIPPHELGHP